MNEHESERNEVLRGNILRKCMKKQITNEIIKWIGDDTYFPERESDDLDEGYNTALADLRNKAPELDQSIIAIFVSKIQKQIDDIYEEPEKTDDDIYEARVMEELISLLQE